jgi:hypothetical protein
MYPLPNRLRLFCLAIVFCAYTSITSAEEVQTTATQTEHVQPEETNKSELVFEFNPYYTDIDLNVPLTNKPIPTISSDNEAVIYSKLIEGSLVPRYMVLEASVNPLPLLGTTLKSHSPHFYQQGELGHTGVNLFESATTGFPEPWAVSALFGNMAKLKRTQEQRQGDHNYGYTGYLISAGNKHIKSNTLIQDNWYELEWKIKGKVDYPDEKMSWSFRFGGRFNNNKNVRDVTYVSLERSNLDLRFSFLEWLQNANYKLRMDFLQTGAQMVRLELTAGKKLPMPEWGFAPTLDIGFIWSSPNEYSGALRDMRGNTTTLIFRPSIDF